jgi:hypothetical protein
MVVVVVVVWWFFALLKKVSIFDESPFSSVVTAETRPLNTQNTQHTHTEREREKESTQ